MKKNEWTREDTGETFGLIERLKFLCPFHGQDKPDVIIAEREEDGEFVALHGDPQCERFIELDVLNFVRAARLAGARPLN